jgi:hypothetical protein
MDNFSSFSEIQKLKMHIFKMFWDTIGCTEKDRDLSEGARKYMGDMERYWDIAEGVRDIIFNFLHSCTSLVHPTFSTHGALVMIHLYDPLGK